MNKEKIYKNKINIILLATLCCALWGSAFPAIKIEYDLFNILPEDIGSKLIFAGYRFALAGFLVLIVQLIEKKNIFVLNKKQAFEVASLGLMQTALQYICFYVGLGFTTGISGSIINGSGAFFSIILAHFIYSNDKINKDKILGCIIGFIGVVLVNLRGGGSLQLAFTFKGEGLIMLSALMLSLGGIYGKKITEDQDPAIVTGYQLLIGGIILIVLGFSFGGELKGFTLGSTVLLVYMAFLSAVAFVIWSQLMKYNKVGTISMYNFLTPVFGTVLSALFLGENLFDIKIFIALILVTFGIFLVYRKAEE